MAFVFEDFSLFKWLLLCVCYQITEWKAILHPDNAHTYLGKGLSVIAIITTNIFVVKLLQVYLKFSRLTCYPMSIPGSLGVSK